MYTHIHIYIYIYIYNGAYADEESEARRGGDG